MSGVGEISNGDRRTQLEERAQAVRSRLEERLEVLDDRRDRVVAIARKAVRPPFGVLLLGVAGVLATGIIVRKLSRRPSTADRIFSLLQAPPVRSTEGFLARAIKGAVLSVVATAVQRLSTQGLDRFLPEPAPPVPAVPRPRPR
jgi:hypothetical protein